MKKDDIKKNEEINENEDIKESRKLSDEELDQVSAAVDLSAIKAQTATQAGKFSGQTSVIISAVDGFAKNSGQI